jgi:hypothetical protein
MGVCCTEQEMFARFAEVHRVLVPRVNRFEAEDWLLAYDSVYFAVTRLFPEPGVDLNHRQRVFLLDNPDVAFELRMRFG